MTYLGLATCQIISGRFPEVQYVRNSNPHLSRVVQIAIGLR